MSSRSTTAAVAAVLKENSPSSPYRAPQPDAQAQFRLDCESIATVLESRESNFDRDEFLEQCGLGTVDRRIHSTQSVPVQVKLQRRANEWFLDVSRGTGHDDSSCLVRLSPQDGGRLEVLLGYGTMKPRTKG